LTSAVSCHISILQTYNVRILNEFVISLYTSAFVMCWSTKTVPLLPSTLVRWFDFLQTRAADQPDTPPEGAQKAAGAAPSFSSKREPQDAKKALEALPARSERLPKHVSAVPSTKVRTATESDMRPVLPALREQKLRTELQRIADHAG
jgi:hypothetical protein